MFYDLNISLESLNDNESGAAKGKGKGKEVDPVAKLSEKQQASLDRRIDLLTHLGYNVIALNQTITGPFNAKHHQNILEGITPRPDVVILKRLTIILNEECEKGTGLVATNAEALRPYDIIALCPTTQSTFQQSCLTYSVASPVAAHIITFDLQANQRLGFFLKQSLVQTAIKNGAVFEIRYFTAVRRAGNNDRSRRNWWINAKEVVRATAGKGLVLSSGGSEAEVRGPQDVVNLATLLGCKQDQAHHAVSRTVQSLLLRAQTRQTYRAVLSEPRLIEAGASIFTATPPTLPQKRARTDDPERPQNDRGLSSNAKQGKRRSEISSDRSRTPSTHILLDDR